MSLAVAGAVVVMLCVASIALSISGIIGHIPGFSAGAGKPATAATHTTPPAAQAPGTGHVLADEASAANGAIPPAPPMDR